MVKISSGSLRYDLAGGTVSNIILGYQMLKQVVWTINETDRSGEVNLNDIIHTSVKPIQTNWSIEVEGRLDESQSCQSHSCLLLEFNFKQI